MKFVSVCWFIQLMCRSLVVAYVMKLEQIFVVVLSLLTLIGLLLIPTAYWLIRCVF